MSKETQASDAAVASSFSGSFAANSRSAARDFVFGILAVIYEMITLVVTKLVQTSVIFWTFLHAKMIVPVSIYAVGILSLIVSSAANFKYRFRTFSHRATCAFAQVRANRFALAAVIMSITLLIISSTIYSVGVKITVDGEDIGYVYSKDQYDEAISFVESRATEILGRPYSVSAPVRFELGIVPRESIVSKDTLSSFFFSRIDEVSALYALTVNGEVVGASKSRETLQKMLDELLYTSDPNVRASFAQDVQITQRYVDSAYLISYEEIREKLKSSIHSTREYAIEYGDTLDSIAKKNGMTVEALRELNPSLSNSRLRAGRKVIVGKEVPFLSVQAIRRVEYTETIPYETTKVESASLYKGSTKVAVQGKVGKRKVVADVTYVDNKETSRNVLSSTVVSQPVTKVIHVGTKARPKTVATGRLSRPVSGAIISSNYGMRRGSMHKGVDFAARSGTRISAADGGTVTWAGWKRGGWGYLVVINHGNGMETYYAHNSKVLVRKGQKVAKGEQIARMGSTGNSSGPHCHFEVHVNGRYVNPWKYIS